MIKLYSIEFLDSSLILKEWDRMGLKRMTEPNIIQKYLNMGVNDERFGCPST